jgi:peptidoglycan/LPS O-acetylase OafA/YrhL
MAQPRNVPLDVLRCIAIFLVMGRHFGYYTLWAKIGWVGVDLFFVLSGFLIAGLLFTEYRATRRISFGRFFWRRGLKIWPPFYIFVGTVAALFLLSRHPFPLRGFLSTVFFFQSYLARDSFLISHGPLTHLWSLSVEEHFYLLLPMVLIAIYRKNAFDADPFRGLPVMLALVAAVSLLLRLIEVGRGEHAELTHQRLDGLLAGVVLSYFYHFKKETFARFAGPWSVPIALVCCVPIAVLPDNSWTTQTLGLTTLWIGFAFLVAWSVESTVHQVGMLRPLFSLAAFVGSYSYSIYLWHMLLVPQFHALGGKSGAFWAAVSGSVAFGILAALLIERPALQIRDRLFPNPQALPGLVANSNQSLAQRPRPEKTEID